MRLDNSPTMRKKAHMPRFTSAVSISSALVLFAVGCQSPEQESQPTSAGPGTPKIGEVVFKDDFSLANERGLWSPGDFARITAEGPNGSKCLRVEFPSKPAKTTDKADASKPTVERDVFGKLADVKGGSFVVSRGANAARWKGYSFDIELKVKAEDVPKPPAPWEGVRIAVNYDTPIINYSHSYNGLYGTFDWKTVRFRVRMPADARDASFSLGLIGNAGRVWFSDLTFTIADIPLALRATQNPPSPHKGHDLTRMRGVNATFALLQDNQMGRLANDWKANVFKVTISPVGKDPLDLSVVDARLEEDRARVDKVLADA